MCQILIMHFKGKSCVPKPPPISQPTLLLSYVSDFYVFKNEITLILKND